MSEPGEIEMEIDLPKPEIEETHQIKEELFRAAESGDFTVFKSLPQQQLLNILSLCNEDQRSLLHVAASSGRTEVVKILSATDPLISGINSADEEGWAPLHSAASSGHVEIVEILLSREFQVKEHFMDSTERNRTLNQKHLMQLARVVCSLERACIH